MEERRIIIDVSDKDFNVESDFDWLSTVGILAGVSSQMMRNILAERKEQGEATEEE